MLNILVIEDNPDNMTLVDEILDDAGFHVFQAVNAELGIDMLNTQQIDLILMDISLPQMSGLEATTLIKSRQETAQIPIIALTAHAMQADKEQAMSAGANAFLTKPIDEDILLQTIEEMSN